LRNSGLRRKFVYAFVVGDDEVFTLLSITKFCEERGNEENEVYNAISIKTLAVEIELVCLPLIILWHDAVARVCQREFYE
jgi:hypothetical protein